MMLRTVSLTYSQTNGTMLPGVITNPIYFGLDPKALMAPGLDFVVGLQTDVSHKGCREWVVNPKHQAAQSV